MNLSTSTGLLHQFLLRLMELYFEVQHQPVSIHQEPDALVRILTTVSDDSTLNDDIPVFLLPNFSALFSFHDVADVIFSLQEWHILSSVNSYVLLADLRDLSYTIFQEELIRAQTTDAEF